MSYNEPEGNNSFLNDDDMICQHCDHKDDVSNGEYVNHRWYCDDCFKELFKVCPKCNVCVISVDEEMCEDCLAEKTYDESAEGMFEKLGYKKSEYKSIIDGVVTVHTVSFSKTEDNFNCMFEFDLLRTTHIVIKSICAYRVSKYISVEEFKAIIQFYNEQGWL